MILNPDCLDAIFSLAWLLATHHDASIRNGEEALILARHAVELTQEQSVEALSALAAAQAETGHFTEAAATAQKTLALARTTDKQAMLPRIQEQLQRYQAGLPHREPDTPPKK